MSEKFVEAWALKSRPTNYSLRDRDRVVLKPGVYAMVSGYVYDPVYAPYGTWDSFCVLPDTAGKVVEARTPRVRAGKGENLYFANVDVMISGKAARIRVPHAALRRVENA